MNYAEMSDQEINMAIANVYYSDFDVIESKSRYPSACVLGLNPNQWVDYCNSPADAWPIINEQRISLYYDYEKFGECSAHFGDENGADFEFEHSNKNPLRAAMVVFLMMKEGEGK